MYDEIKSNLRHAYDGKVEERAEKSIDDWKLTLNQDFYQMMTSEGKSTLLEIGAGTGQHGIFFKNLGLDVTCTDLSPAMVAHMRAEGMEAQVMDFVNLYFPDETFDAVYAMNCLLHVPHKDFGDALRSVKRVLKPGGLFFLCQYGGIEEEGPYAGDHYEPKRFFSLWTDEQIQAEVKIEFDLITFRAIEVPGNSRPDMHSQAMVLRKKINP